ncbi:super-infection exclusion protein B [Rhodopseudomonas sp. G2_2311]|uniref:super-infection exclusion protein B n=1 Tax=Rhodopseudomonas sp. G2_2311 TaxID=3114287 RepID=UPI0039C6F36D
MEIIGSIITAVISGGWKLYLAALLASAALLFIPDWLITHLGLGEIKQTYRTYAGIALVASSSLLMVNLISFIGKIALKPWHHRQFTRHVHKALRELTPAEKDFLRDFIHGQANTVSAPINDGVAGGLAAKQIIYRSSNFSYGLEFQYNLQPVPRKLLSAHPELLD